MKSKGSKNKSKSPLELLRSTLSPALRNKHFVGIKTRILQLGLENLDFKLNTSEQPDVLLEIETKLVEEFSNVFYGPLAVRRLQYARQAIVRQHGEQRSKRGLSKKRLQKGQKENANTVDGEILDLTLDEDSDEELPPRTLPRTPQRNSSTLRGESRATTLHPRIKSRWAYSTLTSQAGTPSILSSVSAQRLVTPNASASHASASSSSQVNMGERGLNHIHYFLKSCSPPLGHLLSRFIDLGFKSVDILNEVAFHWTGDERRDTLQKLRVPQGGVVSEVELTALERRFQKYFLESLNGM